MEEQLKEKPSNAKNKGAVKKNFQRKPPVIKHTLTSVYRMAKTNPLLVSKDKTNEYHVDNFGLNQIKLPQSVVFPNRCISRSIKSSVTSNQLSNSSIKTATVRNNTINKRENTKPLSPSINGKKGESTSKNIDHYEKSNPGRKRWKVLEPSNADNKPVKKNTRRSLSAEHYDRKKQTSVEYIDINDLKNILKPPSVSPITEEVGAHRRRSISLTFVTPTPVRKHCTSTPSSTGCHLQQNLEEWLRNHQKSVNSYKQLKCFGLYHYGEKYAKLDEQNKENIEEMQTTNLRKSTSYENLNIIFSENSASATTVSRIACRNKHSYIDNRTIVHDALTELHELIFEGYPQQDCEVWLGMIRQNYYDLDEEPLYWECRAALEQAKNNITSAVKCLQTAIVQGAKVEQVDHCLEQLLGKFSLFSISDDDKSDIKKIDRERIVLDARNVFKSSIIQLGIQERKLKK